MSASSIEIAQCSASYSTKTTEAINTNPSGYLATQTRLKYSPEVSVDISWGCSIALWQKMHDRQRSRLTNNVQRPTDCATQDLNFSATATQTHNTQLR